MEIIFSIISIVILIAVVSFSYAYIKLEKQETDVNVLGTDCIKLEMIEESEAITLHHAYPVTDEVGQQSTPYTFKLTNECGVGVDYEIHLRKEEGSTIEASNIATSVDGHDKVVLKEEQKVTNEEEPDKEEYKINKDNLTLKPYEEVEHNIRIWLDKDAGNETQNGIFKSKVVIEAIQNQTAIYTEKILNGADPVLYETKEDPLAMLTALEGEPTTADTLIPIKINKDNGEVTKADVTTEWYNYEKKEWANAVILVDNEKAKELKPNDVIKEEEIESYFVWIPKYRYKIFDMGHYDKVEGTEYKEKSQPIEIEFGLENTKDDDSNLDYKECATPNASGADGNCHVGDWMTHPAFTAFENSKGFWVGKFETGYNQDTTNSNTINVTESWTKSGAEQNIESSSKVIIKPNVYSWRNITVGNAYHTSYEYQRELDSHMMKNTEWGAVAYLTQSIYGMCTNNESTTCNEVTINSNTNYVTGYTGPSTAYPNSTASSTTGNNTGIFDMSGGSWEYVIGYMSDNVKSSGLLEETDLTVENSKYFDKYENKTDMEWSKRILGDATGELEPFGMERSDRISSWYKDWAWFPNSYNPWFGRGGGFADNTKAGVFAFSRYSGDSFTYFSFRLVCAP